MWGSVEKLRTASILADADRYLSCFNMEIDFNLDQTDELKSSP